MQGREVSGLFLTLLLVSVLTLTLKTRQVKADWIWTETIYIRADGSVDPSTAPIQRDEDIYTFTDNIFETSHIQETLEIQKDNIIIDGSGFTLQGVMGHGIKLSGRQNVPLKNTRIVGSNRLRSRVNDICACGTLSFKCAVFLAVG